MCPLAVVRPAPRRAGLQKYQGVERTASVLPLQGVTDWGHLPPGYLSSVPALLGSPAPRVPGNQPSVLRVLTPGIFLLLVW
jgi:hypothetical protein